ncbi:DUF6603 domain-containing protein [Streptomyces wuyuanensis]|uniref:DUF6603 domain-containing protein n=1 Tax=Streptomyces wuyuanensis TaxID=1196353 RepID=UPI003434F15C
MTDSSSARKWTLLGEIKLGAYLQIPLLDSLTPAGANIGIDDLTVGFNAKKLEDADVDKLRELVKDVVLPDSADKRWQAEGPFLAAKVQVGSASQLLIFAPSPSPSPSPPPPKTAAYEGIAGLPGSMGEGQLAHVAGGTEAVATGGSSNEAVAWWNVDRTVGPVHVGRVGVGYEAKSVLLLADVDVGGGGFRFGTKGLGTTIPIGDPKHPALHLDGLSLGYNRAPLTIAGEFVRQDIEGYSLAVGGMAVIGTPAASVTALGFYAQPQQGDPSLFVFGMLDLSKKSVGSGIFRLEKIAAGFGLHSQVRTPTLAEVGTFPFVDMLSKGYAQRDPLDELTNLLNKKWVTPARGEMWLAAGLEALIYELVDINAVAIVQFGDEIVAGLYGQASAQFPKHPAKACAVLAMDVRAEYRSSTDTLEIDAALANGSFVLDPACRLTGGAAVRLWFGRSAHPGEFVVTIGGYNPNFVVPEYYPRPGRLGFDWRMPGGIHAWGNCYAALTPHAFMAGLKAGLSGDWGPASIDAEVYADALIEWDPLYFKVEWGGNIRGSIGPFSAELGADGTVWGPPVGGNARVKIIKWHINVDFGASDPKGRTPLKAKEFRDRMLPGGTRPGAGSADGTAPGENSKVVTVAATQGLLPAPTGNEDPAAVWAFGVGSFALQVTSAVPLTAVSVNETKVATSPTRPRANLYIRPMQADGVDSGMVITLKDPTGESVKVSNKTPGEGEDITWSVMPDSKGVPAALWAKKDEEDEKGLAYGYATGITLTPPSPIHTKEHFIPGSADKNEKEPIQIQTEAATLDYTADKNGNRLPAMPTSRLNTMSDAAAKNARNGILADLTKMEMPGFSADGLVTDMFTAGAAGYLNAAPQLLEGDAL